MDLDIQTNTDLESAQFRCHRSQPLMFPAPLGKLTVAHLPCIRDKCTLWDAPAAQCRDVTNAHMLTAIASHLGVILDHLPPELP